VDADAPDGVDAALSELAPVLPVLDGDPAEDDPDPDPDDASSAEVSALSS
jgi:hypothetical protein